MIEILFPDLCTLYGDIGNYKYLEKCLPNHKFVYTTLSDEIKFKGVSMIYMGSMTELGQEKAIERLMPYKEQIKKMIDDKVVFLLTGNSFEIFNNYIMDGNKKIEGLGLIDMYSERIMPKRSNTLFLGEFKDFDVVGYSSRFSHTYGDNSKNYLFKCNKGFGINPKSKYEGIRIKNLFATYLLGPLLIQNPYFTSYLIKLMSKENKLYLKNDLLIAYEERVNELQKM